MRVLHWLFSDRFTDYLTWFRSVSDKHVDFFYTDAHPDPAVHPRQAMVEIQKRRARVFIHRNIDNDQAEENAAHELTHLALMDMGYCYPVLKKHQKLEWQQIANALLSWTSDVIIDRKLEDFGYDNQEYKQMVWENTLKHLEMYPRESQPGAEEIFNALGYFYCFHSVTPAQWKELLDVYERVDPPAYRLGEMLISLGHQQEFFSQEGYCAFLARVRDELGLGDIIDIAQPESETML